MNALRLEKEQLILCQLKYKQKACTSIAEQIVTESVTKRFIRKKAVPMFITYGPIKPSYNTKHRTKQIRTYPLKQAPSLKPFIILPTDRVSTSKKDPGLSWFNQPSTGLTTRVQSLSISSESTRLDVSQDQQDNSIIFINKDKKRHDSFLPIKSNEHDVLTSQDTSFATSLGEGSTKSSNQNDHYKGGNHGQIITKATNLRP